MMPIAAAESPMVPLSEAPASFALAAVSGFVDTAGFILLNGIFTSHVTGNLVLAGAALAGAMDGGVRVRLALLGVFMVAVGTTSLASRFAAAFGRQSLAPLLLAESAFLALFVVVGMRWHRGDLPMSDGRLFLVSSAAVVAMGVQNALSREHLTSFLPTTMMTGNTTQLTLDLVAAVRGDRSPRVWTRLRRTATVVGGFVVGAAAGALGAASVGIAAVAIPAVLVVGIAWRARLPTSRVARRVDEPGG